MSNVVAIVGRPNVGKSTLFNRMVTARQAIVDNVSGVTRDRHYGICEWNGKNYNVIDTGGYVNNSDDIFEAAINEQVLIAIEEATAIIFMVDVTTGITDLDHDLARMLRKSKKPVLFIANKVDNEQRLLDVHNFYGLGLGEPMAVASISGSGTGDLLDEIDKHLSDEEMAAEDGIPHISIVGRPNVGKSSLVNALMDQPRNIVTPIAGTTRDSIHTHYNKFGLNFKLVDTAGLRKKGKVEENIEFYSVIRAIRALDNSDICVIVLDAQNGVESQDLNILHLAERKQKGVVVVVNKWDLIEKDTNSAKEFEEKIRRKTAPFVDFPIVFTSAINKQRVLKVMETANEVYHARRTKVPTSKLNEVMLQEIENYQPPATKGKFIKIKYITQLPGYTPKFALFCNLPQYIKEPYKRFIENKIREHYGFHGVPLRVFFRKK